MALHVGRHIPAPSRTAPMTYLHEGVHVVVSVAGADWTQIPASIVGLQLP